MSVTTKSMVLLAAMGLAACESSNSNTLTPPVLDAEKIDLEDKTQANAVADLTAGDANVVTRASAADAARSNLATATTKFDDLSDLRVDMLAILGSVTDSGDLSKPDRDELALLVTEFNNLLGQDSNQDNNYVTTGSGDAVARLNAYFETTDTNLGKVALDLKTATDTFNTAIAALKFTDIQPVREAFGKDIVLADGTVLQTAGLAVYTRVDESAVADTVLTPTATAIVAYEADADGNPINVRFLDYGGIGYEGAPTGTAFAEGDGVAYAYLHFGGEDAMRVLSGVADLSLNFDQQTGSLNIFVYGNDTVYASRSTLTFDRLTGKFASTSGDFLIVRSDELTATGDEYIVGNNVTVEGGLQGLSEAFSGKFTITDSRVNGEGGFAGTVDTTASSLIAPQ